MNKIYFEVADNTVIKHTPRPEFGENVYKTFPHGRSGSEGAGVPGLSGSGTD